MEPSEYLRILKKQKQFFWSVAFGVIVLGLLWQQTQPQTSTGVLLLNIGRVGGAPASGEYTYDNFYRLQADERFADTLVRWLENPRFVLDTLSVAGVPGDEYSEKELSHIFAAKRLSSQVVEVRFGNPDSELIKKMSQALLQVSDRYTRSLNSDQENWFSVVGSEPVIRDGRTPLWPFTGLLVAVALFIAFFGTFLKDFWERQHIRTDKY